jgi:hypothetical protein
VWSEATSGIACELACGGLGFFEGLPKHLRCCACFNGMSMKLALISLRRLLVHEIRTGLGRVDGQVLIPVVRITILASTAPGCDVLKWWHLASCCGERRVWVLADQDAVPSAFAVAPSCTNM